MASRAEIRTRLANLLRVYYTGFEQVWPYMKGDFKQNTPVAEVTSAGSLRVRQTAQGSLAKPFYIDIYVYALYSDQAGTWTEEDAEDTLDAVEAAINDMVNENRSCDLWIAMQYGERSQVLPNFQMGGVIYRREVIHLEVVGR